MGRSRSRQRGRARMTGFRLRSAARVKEGGPSHALSLLMKDIQAQERQLRNENRDLKNDLDAEKEYSLRVRREREECRQESERLSTACHAAQDQNEELKTTCAALSQENERLKNASRALARDMEQLKTKLQQKDSGCQMREKALVKKAHFEDQKRVEKALAAFRDECAKIFSTSGYEFDLDAESDDEDAPGSANTGGNAKKQEDSSKIEVVIEEQKGSSKAEGKLQEQTGLLEAKPNDIEESESEASSSSAEDEK